MDDENVEKFFGAVLLGSLALIFIPFLKDFDWVGGIAIFLIGAYFLVKEDED